MKLTITARRIELTPALSDYVEKKIRKAEKYSNRLVKTHITLSREKHRYIAEFTIGGARRIFRGKEEAGDMYSAVDKLMDKIEVQLNRYKEKLKEHHRSEESELRNLRKESRGFKYEQVELLTFSEEEAFREMTQNKRKFFFFLNRDTKNVALFYYKGDGNLALLEARFREEEIYKQ